MLRARLNLVRGQVAEFVAYPIQYLHQELRNGSRAGSTAESVAHALPEIVGGHDQLCGEPVEQRRHVFFADSRLHTSDLGAKPCQVPMLLKERVHECLVLQPHRGQALQNALFDLRAADLGALIQQLQGERGVTMGERD